MATFSLSDILREARRRRVFRLAAIYVVGAWVFVQIALAVFPAFEIPDTAIRYVWLGVALVLPIALVFSWRYDIKGGRIVRTGSSDANADLSIRRADIVILGGLSIVIAVVSFGLVSEVSKTRAPAATLPVLAEVDPNSIAVLPFLNMSDDPNNEYFADGISEELLNVLARIPELKVASRTSSFSFKGKDVGVATIAETLQVDNVLEGSVRAHANQIRVTATLVRNGTVLWTDTYDRGLNDILDVQSEIAYSVASAIAPVLSPESETRVARRATKNVEAYDYYLRGLD